MMAADLMPRAKERDTFVLQPDGPRWSSIDQLRKEGARKLEERLGPDQIGWLRARNNEYVIMRAPTWHKAYARAQEVNRLEGTLVLIRQAIKLVFTSKKEGERLALEHLSDLVFQVPELVVQSHEPSELVFDDIDDTDEEDIEVGNLELGPRKVRHLAKARR